MSKYKLTDIKVGAVFKNGNEVRTILMVGRADVFFSYVSDIIYWESSVAFNSFLGGHCGELVKPDIKTEKIKTRKGTLAWAMVQLAKGLKVKGRRWDASSYIQLRGELNAQSLVTNRGEQPPGWLRSAIGWELYKEKEDKII